MKPYVKPNTELSESLYSDMLCFSWGGNGEPGVDPFATMKSDDFVW